MPDVKPRASSLRQRQALETRRAIARAARQLFGERGYAATSVEAVAETAGVAPRTVYAAFGSKKNILAAICDEWLAEAGVMESVAEGMAQPSLRGRLAVVARASRAQWQAERGVVGMLEGAAASDAEVARMVANWKADRARSLRALFLGVESELRPGLAAGYAGAVLRALAAFEVYSELVEGEGWTPDEYEAWLCDLLIEVLAAPDSSTH